MANPSSKNPIQLQQKIKFRKLKQRNSVSPLKSQAKLQGIIKLFEVPSSPGPLASYKRNAGRVYKNEIVRLFEWTGHTPESRYDEWDVDMDLAIKEVDEIVNSCHQTAAQAKANTQPEIVFKKVKSPKKARNKRKRAKTSRSDSNLHDLDINRKFSENREASPNKSGLIQRSKSKNIMYTTPIKSPTKLTARRSESRLLGTSSTSYLHNKTKSRQGSSHNLHRDKSPFEILADFNRVNKRQFDANERQSFMNSTLLQKTTDSVQYSIFEEYQYELEKIRTLKETCDKDFKFWLRDKQRRSPVRQKLPSTHKNAKTELSDSHWSKSLVKSQQDLNTADTHSMLRDKSDSNMFAKIDGIIAQMKAEQERSSAYVL